MAANLAFSSARRCPTRAAPSAAAKRDRKRIRLGLEVQAGMSQHAGVRHLDAAEAMAAAQLDAGAKALMGGDHPTAGVLGIAQAAERRRFQ
ncbi:MAG: hypothetical protein ACREH3_19550, partial [Geminicoccales bacterium]